MRGNKQSRRERRRGKSNPATKRPESTTATIKLSSTATATHAMTLRPRGPKKPTTHPSRTEELAATTMEQNNYLQLTRPPKKVETRPSQIPDAGLGLFAKEPMKKGEFVARFSGEPLTHSQNEKRDSKYRLKIHNDLYLDGEGQHHLEGRYLNSSKGTAQRPNVRFGGGRRIHQCPHTGLMYCRMYATRDIAPDDEMLVPYGQSYWSAYPLQSETVDDNTSSDDDSDSEHGGTDGGDENSSDNEDDSNDEEHQPDGGDSCDCTNGSTDDEHRGTNNNGDKLEDITRDNEDPCDDACDNRNDKHDDAGNNTCDSDDDRPGLCSVTGSSDSESSSGLSCTSDDDSDYDHSETPGGPPKPCDDDSDYRHDEVLECFIVAAQPTTPDELSADGDTDGTPTSSHQ